MPKNALYMFGGVFLALVLFWGFFLGGFGPFSLTAFFMGGGSGGGGWGGGGNSVTVGGKSYATGGQDDIGTTIGPLTGSCDLSAASTMNVLAYDKYTATADTTASSGDWRRVGDISWTAFTPGTAFTVAPDNMYEIQLYDESTAKYGPHKIVYMPCVTLHQFSLPVASVATAAAYSVTVWNSDGTVNSNGVNQTVAAGDIRQMHMQLLGDYQNAYGDIFDGGCPNVLVIKVNNTIDDITFSGDCSGIGEVPGQVSQVTGYQYEAASLPAHDSNSEVFDCYFTIDNTNGQALNELAANELTWTIYDSFPYFDTKDGQTLKCGVEDEYDSDSGIATEETGQIYTQDA